ncbi:hypothetical protein A1OE_916 [Candidatus Endolissoclinum faulkneri L2]|uniref:Uncharacterized protein n=1 Tax=Candidatus Endolissoclinum faulkneri L2 TaxID=1193729 RepID=K7YHP0_9PROT|nr:hypothetical protein A1OE_916 [Candidatus Endolissoclinum faulkneri L2]
MLFNYLSYLEYLNTQDLLNSFRIFKVMSIASNPQMTSILYNRLGR